MSGGVKGGARTRVVGAGTAARPSPALSPASARWLGWLAVLVCTTGVCRALRGSLDQTQVALVYLLIVLGGSASGGRALGGTLAVLCFGLIDYFFQAPYDSLAVGKGLDWVVLFAFLVTATVATNLLARARSEAAEAERRTDEARALARLGAETLRHASPADALASITALIQRTLGVAVCSLRAWDADRGLDATAFDAPVLDAPVLDAPVFDATLVDAGTGATSNEVPATLLAAAAERGRALVVRTDGAHVWLPAAPLDGLEPGVVTGVTTLVLPLYIEQRVVGVLGVADPRPIALAADRRRFLTALVYYAAVAIERRELSAAAAHAAAVQEAGRLKDRVLASVSHDLRTPLTTIKVLAHGAAMEGSAAGVIIEEQADRLARLVTDVLDLSRLRGHDVPLDTQLNTAEDVVGAAVRQAQGIVGDRQLVLALDFTSEALVGRFDFAHTLRVVGNLIENALRYTPSGGVVEISAAQDDEWLAIAVADRGPGVAPGERESIFEPFYRPSGAPPDAGRAGLGLAIAREFAAAQSGTLAYAPRPGGGSVFTLRLPAAHIDEMVDELADDGDDMLAEDDAVAPPFVGP